jgi:hypothetical protein
LAILESGAEQGWRHAASWANAECRILLSGALRARIIDPEYSIGHGVGLRVWANSLPYIPGGMAMPIADGHDDALKLLNDQIAGRSTFIRLGAIALLVAYVATIELGFNSAYADWFNVFRYNVGIFQVRQSFDHATSNLLKIYGAPPIRIVPRLTTTHAKLRELNAELRARTASRAHDKLQANVLRLHGILKAGKEKIVNRFASTTRLPLPGVEIDLPFNLVATAWLLGACYLLLYAAQARRRSHQAMITLAATVPPEERRTGLKFPDAPLWVVPFPWQRRSFSADTQGVFDRVDMFSLPYSLLSLFAATVGFAICMRVMQLNYDWTNILPTIRVSGIDTALESTLWNVMARAVLPLTIAVIVASIGIYLFLPSHQSAKDAQVPNTARRYALYGILATAAASTVPITWLYEVMFEREEHSLLTRAVNLARRLRVKRIGDLLFQTRKAKGFYKNPDSQRLHYVNAHGQAYALSASSKLARFVPATLSTADPAARLSQSRLGHVVELAALETFRIGKDGTISPTKLEVETACNILLRGIQESERHSPRPCYRLLDLAAGIAYRYEALEVLGALELLSRRSRFVENKRYRDALQKRSLMVAIAANRLSSAALPEYGPSIDKAEKPLRVPATLGRWSNKNPLVRWGTFGNFALSADPRATAQYLYFGQFSGAPPRKPLPPKTLPPKTHRG